MEYIEKNVKFKSALSGKYLINFYPEISKHLLFYSLEPFSHDSYVDHWRAVASTRY